LELFYSLFNNIIRIGQELKGWWRMVQYAKRRKAMDYTIESMHNIMESLTNKELISFGGGAPAKEAYPIEQIKKVTQSILNNEEKMLQGLSYGPTIGLAPLREEIIKALLVPNGIQVNLNDVMVTAGGIQGLYLVGRLFLNPGDVVLVESPTFIHAKMVFDGFEAKFVSCPMASDGLDIEILEEKIKKYQPKIIYTMPTFHNPTGISMSVEKRKEMARIAESYNVIILEDDPYREIRYSNKDIKPIKSYTDSKNIIYTSSLSKIFSPGARLGYLVADSEIIKELVEMKLSTDTCTNGFTQMICAEFFKKGYYPLHLEKITDIYQSRRDAMAKTIDLYFPEGTKRTSPDGGFYIWVELPKGLDGRKLLSEVNKTVRITYGCGSDFFVEENEEGGQFIRFSFAGIETDVIEKSMRTLGNFFISKLR
jgi:2-aminoadipate transaminase